MMSIFVFCLLNFENIFLSRIFLVTGIINKNQTISVKNPICSIFAEGDSETQVENILYKRLEEIELFVKSI